MILYSNNHTAHFGRFSFARPQTLRNAVSGRFLFPLTLYSPSPVAPILAAFLAVSERHARTSHSQSPVKAHSGAFLVSCLDLLGFFYRRFYGRFWPSGDVRAFLDVYGAKLGRNQKPTNCPRLARFCSSVRIVLFCFCPLVSVVAVLFIQSPSTVSITSSAF